MASEKSKLAKNNLKTSLYFAGSITFGTVAIGTAVSIPVYLDIKKSLNSAMQQFSNLSKYLTQLTQKLGLPDDSEFEQELANGYVAVYTPEGGTKVYKEVNGKKVLVMNTNSDGTVKTAASFEGVEALTMLAAMDSAKEAFDNESEAMKSILEEYSDTIDDSSYLTESITTSKSVAILVLRDELAGYDVNNITQQQKDEAIQRANAKLSPGIASRNNLIPNHVEIIDIKEAIDMIKTRQAQIELDRARAANILTDAQKEDLAKIQQTQKETLEKAQKELDDVKQKQSETAAKSAQKVAEVTQAKVVEKASKDPGGNASFIFANTSTFQKWFALLGATFGNVGGNNVSNHAASIVLREPIANQLEKNGLEEDKFLNLKDYLLEIIGLENHKNDWKTTREQAHKKIMTVTPLLNTFANTEEDTRVIIFDIKVNNIDTGKIEDYFLLAHPSTNLAYDFEKYSVVGEDLGIYQGHKNQFEKFSKTITQLSLIASSKTLHSLNELAFAEILTIIEELHKGQATDINKIKLTANTQINAKLEEFIRKYANDEKTNGILEEFGRIIFESNFKSGGNDIAFEAKDLSDFIHLLIEKDGFTPDSNLTSKEIYEGYEKQPLMNYIINNITSLGNDISVIKKTFEDNWNSFEEIDNVKEIKNADAKLLFDTNIQRLLPSQNKTLLKDVKELLSAYPSEFINLLKQNPVDLSPYINHLKFIKTLNLDDKQMTKILPLVLDSKLFSKFNELEIIASKTDKIPGTTLTYQAGVENYIKSELDAFVAQMNVQNSQLQKYIEQYNWIQTFNLTSAQYSKLKQSIFDSKLFNKFSELLSIFNQAGNVPNTSLSYKDEVVDFIKTNTDAFVVQINKASSKLQTFIENFAWVRDLNLDDATFAKINTLLTDEQYFDTWEEIIKLANNVSWTPDDDKGVPRTGLKAVKQYFSKEPDTLNEQFKNNIDIIAIKESIRYSFKGVNVSDPSTQERIDAAKDVAKDLDNIQNLDAASKVSIQSSIERVITSKSTQSLTSDEFDTIMKYTQTVFKLFHAPTDATKQLQKVLEPTQLTANNHAIVKHIATLNKWVQEIAQTNPNTTITLAMIKDYAWKDGVVSTTYKNGDNSVDIVDAQSNGHLLLAGAQLTSNDKIMTIGSYMWGLWELEHTQNSNETKITPVVPSGSKANLSQPSDGWASAPYYNDGNMYAIPLINSSSKVIYKYDATGKEQKIPINVTTNSKETRTAIVIDIGAKKMAYGFSNDGYFDEYDITNQTSAVPQTHVAYSTISALNKWSPSWTATTFKINNENYVVVPMDNYDTSKYGLSFWHIEPSGHLKFINIEQFDSATQSIIFQSTHQKDPSDPSKVIKINSGVSTNAIVSGEADGDKASLFMLGSDGKLWNFKFESLASKNGQFIVDNNNSGVIIDAASILPQVKQDANDKTKTTNISNPWRGMTYNITSHEINIYGITGAIYIPNQNQKIADIYEKLLT